LIELYSLVIILSISLSFFPELRPHKIAQIISEAAEFTCGPVRKGLPQSPFDISPVVVMIILSIIKP
jgi:YggT family protein